MYYYPTYPRFVIDNDKYNLYKHISKEQLIKFINYQDINKIYDSINITMARAVQSYKSLLLSIENSLKNNINNRDLKALLDIRNDIIHNSSTIDIEKHMYIEVMNLNNSKHFIVFNLYFRDYDEYGKKIEFYGDIYQVEQKNNFEVFLSNCIDKTSNIVEKFQEYILDENSYKTLQ